MLFGKYEITEENFDRYCDEYINRRQHTSKVSLGSDFESRISEYKQIIKGEQSIGFDPLIEILAIFHDGHDNILKIENEREKEFILLCKYILSMIEKDPPSISVPQNTFAGKGKVRKYTGGVHSSGAMSYEQWEWRSS